MTEHSREEAEARFFLRGLILRALLVTVTAFMGIARDAAAQSNLEKFVVTGKAAERIFTKIEISSDTAARIVQACLNYANSINQVIAVVILGPSGQMVHFQRMDGARTYVVDALLPRAQTALYWRESTRVLENEAEGIGDLARQMRLYQLGQYPVDGGLPIIVDGQLIGAIGVTGGRGNNEEIAKVGLTAVLGPQPPAAPKLTPRQFAPGGAGAAPEREGQGARQPQR